MPLNPKPEVNLILPTDIVLFDIMYSVCTVVHAVCEEIQCFSRWLCCLPLLLFLHPVAFSSAERFQDVVVRPQPDTAVEGAENFTLLYSMREGVVMQQAWFFNGKAINTDSHYLVRQRSLVILKPHRNDTGPYTLVLSNPFSEATANMTVIVRCKNY